MICKLFMQITAWKTIQIVKTNEPHYYTYKVLGADQLLQMSPHVDAAQEALEGRAGQYRHARVEARQRAGRQ